MSVCAKSSGHTMSMRNLMLNNFIRSDTMSVCLSLDFCLVATVLWYSAMIDDLCCCCYCQKNVESRNSATCLNCLTTMLQLPDYFLSVKDYNDVLYSLRFGLRYTVSVYLMYAFNANKDI